MFSLAICDDDRNFVHQVSSAIQIYNQNHADQDNILVEEYTSPQFLLDDVNEGQWFDVFLLDVEMPELDGMQLAENIKTRIPYAIIIFLTSHIEYASDGYKVDAVRFLSKLKIENGSNEALDEALDEALSEAIRRCKKAETSYLTVTHYHDVMRIQYDDIIYVNRLMRTLEIVTTKQGIINDRHGLNEIHTQLNDRRFIFIGRSCFINIDHLLQISNSEVLLKNGERLPVSRKYLASVKNCILQLWGENG